MFVNVLVNGRSDIRVSIVSVAELRAIERNISKINAEADDKLQDVIDEGDTQIVRVIAEGDTQVAVVISEGDTQVARVIAEGDTQVIRASDEADRAETEADRATTQANEIKSVTVASPVTSIPLLPGNEPGIPTVTYDPITGEFAYGIPIGKTGETAQVVTPQGGTTVAELNALVADPAVGSAWWMEDAGTITYGDPDTPVLVDEIVVWVAEGYFFNMGVLESGSRWDLVTDVTVEGFAPVAGDDLARFGTSYTKAEQDAIDLVQNDAIALNTAKVTGADRVPQSTYDAAQQVQDDAIALNTAKVTGADRVLQSAYDTKQSEQDAAIALNTAKVSYKDTMTFDGTTLTITIG